MKKIFFICLLLSLLGSEIMAQAAGRVYRDHCFSSNWQTVYPGSYPQNQLYVGNDKISSVNMYNNNYFVRLYEHNYYWGEYRDIYYDMTDLTSIDFGDKTSSIQVLTNNYDPVTSNEPILSANILNGKSIDHVSSTSYWIHEDELYDVSRLHMQGLGQNTAKNRIILTGCKASSKTSGCTGGSLLCFSSEKLPNFAGPNANPQTAEDCQDIVAVKDSPLTQIKYYPNPARDFLYVENPPSPNTEVILYNQLGQEVVHHSDLLTEKKIDLRPLNPGLYHLAVIQNRQIISLEKVIILH